MGTDLKIYEIENRFSELDENPQIILTYITTVYNYETIEKLQEIGNKNWHVESECGAEFELLGEHLNSIKKELSDYEFEAETWYRCSLSS